MAQPTIQIPLEYPLIKARRLAVYRIVFDLEVKHVSGRFIRTAYEFRLDTGADFTTIPIDLATKLGMYLDPKEPVFPNTAAGKAKNPSYIAKLCFSFPQLPQFQFLSICLVNTDPMRRCLFSLNDLVPNFFVRSRKATPTHPHGLVALQLRSDHTGQPR